MQKKEYDIIKMVQHGKYCERIQDTVSGQTLIYWLKYHPQTEKEELWNLMRKLLLQITWFHKYGEKQTYGCLSPYSVIVKEDGEIYLLDPETEGSRETMRQIQSRTVRKYFSNPEIYRQRGICEAADIYGFGRTLQYMLSQSEPDPPLTTREEYKLAKLIQNCLETDGEKGYTDFSMVQKHFPKLRSGKGKKEIEKNGMERKGREKKVAAVVLGCAVLFLLGSTALKTMVGQEKKKEEVMQADEAGEQAGKNFEPFGAAEKIEEIVRKISEQEQTIDGQVLALETYLKESGRKEDQEEAFLCLAQWYEGKERIDDAAEICRRGRKVLPQSEALALAYLEILWKVEGLEPEMKEQATKGIITELPEIQEQEQFGTLKRAYGF